MKLSIITVNLNNAAGLRKTMESVFAQTYRDFEYIVIDGASTDDSVKVIREYEAANQAFPNPLTFIWKSEPDTGIYNAMNKGLKMSHGEYSLMLNSGDYLVDEQVIEHVGPELHTEDMIQGNEIVEYPNYTIRDRGYGRSNISFLDAMDGYILHQATFIRLSLLERYGYYDESYKKASDSYFFIRAICFGDATFRYMDVDVTNFDPNGISSKKNEKWVQIAKIEDARWYSENIPPRLKELYRTAPTKIRIYDTLSRNKLIWFFVRILKRIAEWLSPIPKKIQKERIDV